ncbi:MAG TPA: hypothetical protein PLL69_03020 [Gemmatimonadales bacterium]|nr:hypothetical protein [Gemmatimonadales bacterium]
MPDSTDLTAVEALLAERDSLRGWLDRLDQSGVAAPESVRARVRGDYQTRLDRLTEELRSHADAVAARLAADIAERDRLLDLALHAREGLAEAELRHVVGEFDAGKFEEERARHTSELDGLESELNELAERIAGLEDVHAAVTRPASPDQVAVPPVLELAENIADDPVAVRPAEALEPESDNNDSLLSIFDDGPAVELRPPAPVEESGSGPRSEPGPAGFGPLSFTPNDAAGTHPGPAGPGRPARPAVPSMVPPIGLPAADQSPRFVRPAPERGSELVELAADRNASPLSAESVRVVPEPEPVVPESSPDTDTSARTLRCGECGSMNRPLEWYCEKCGAELTTV